MHCEHSLSNFLLSRQGRKPGSRCSDENETEGLNLCKYTDLSKDLCNKIEIYISVNVIYHVVENLAFLTPLVNMTKMAMVVKLTTKAMTMMTMTMIMPRMIIMMTKMRMRT